MTYQSVNKSTQSRAQTATVEAACLPDGAAGEVCCNLDSLIQPNFFCGQLLTDQDLTTLLRWSQDKFRLNRYRHGWGVSCGLAVRCDPARSDRVIVTPGYAIDCCGDDLIVNQDTVVDLSMACKSKVQPCLEIDSRNQAQARSTRTARSANFDLVSGLALPVTDLRQVDLYLRYKSVQTDLQTALGRSACNQIGECAYSRTREAYDFTLTCRPVSGEPDPAPATLEAKTWRAGYEACATTVLDWYEKGPKQLTDFLDWIERNPFQQFCFITAWLCDPNRARLSDGDVAKLLYFLIQERRNAYLNRICHACQSNVGVPLARIWLDASEEAGERRCQVIHIDPYPPYRRLLSQDALPAPPGQINLGSLIWQRWPEAKVSLAGLGFCLDDGDRSQFKPETIPDNPAELREWLSIDQASLDNELDFELFAACHERLTVRALHVHGVDRVIGFGRQRTAVYRSTGASARSTTATQPITTQPAPSQPEPEPESDDLTKISGIKEGRQALLYAKGIKTYAALAALPIAELRDIIPRVGDDQCQFWIDEAQKRLRQ